MSAFNGATWRSGYAAVCKTVYTSSILVVASINQIKALPAILEPGTETWLGDAVRMRLGCGHP